MVIVYIRQFLDEDAFANKSNPSLFMLSNLNQLCRKRSNALLKADFTVASSSSSAVKCWYSMVIRNLEADVLDELDRKSAPDGHTQVFFLSVWVGQFSRMCSGSWTTTHCSLVLIVLFSFPSVHTPQWGTAD